MTDFESWCQPAAFVKVKKHTAGMLLSNDDSVGIDAVAATLAEKYAETETLALIAEKLGKQEVATFLRHRFPTKANARSGDMGEILATAFVHEDRDYVVGPSRLIHRDHREWAMRGDDVLGAFVDSESRVHLAKVEAKSGVSITKKVVKDAREGLQRTDGLPSPHSLTQFAERLLGTSDDALGEAVLRLQLVEGVRPGAMTHVIFLFTASDPSELVENDLTAYTGTIKQLAMTLRVNAHQDFIRAAYEKALVDDT